MSKKKEEQQPEVNQEEQAPSLPSVLYNFEGAPTPATVEQWKTTFGEVFVSGFSEEELYVWRPIFRSEWIQLQTETAGNMIALQEGLCNLCILWKSVNVEWDKSKAGALETLQEQIMQKSNFTDPQVASMLVAKL